MTAFIAAPQLTLRGVCGKSRNQTAHMHLCQCAMRHDSTQVDTYMLNRDTMVIHVDALILVCHRTCFEIVC